ncbi:MAG: BadF/BadG/BcrA/BcrD ATPase family protein [Candidatus Microbacterium phytovorans]|uniref:BadF/BadG/BcrA/BcrD ATPase family protein n=1 Tax=Candidatus Microbacterium phytovorans TaxID=3121374 RepID=A0AAJ5VZY6_9MICO|nr:BadF/BadG/BcrA/BcrD ATPase family protein [Microbacterium sp.]WEK13197.1 MAG: BadF/BadG/BcrA/BcrD ATPase family protein [Microbacterium sp.]
MSGVLALDAGQTSMKVRVSEGTTVFEEDLPGIRTSEPLLPQVADVARTALALSGIHADVLSAGVSGLTEREADADALAQLLGDTSIRRVLLAHDSTTAFLGALGDRRGAVVAAGTGVVTLAVGHTDVARVDGWGHTMGDAGSGFWIGREVLAAVMRAYDGRGAETSLTDAVTAVWPSLPDAYITLQAERDWVRRVASFARAAGEHAEAGDAVAGSIIERAARELATSVTTGLRRVGADDDPAARVCTVGGVFRSPLLRAAFAAELTASGVAASLEPSHGDGVDGASTLALLSPAHPFARQIATSG